MALRCFLFSSDEGTADVIRQVLTGLDVEGEFCSVAATATEQIANQTFHLVIIDWEQQPEGGMLLAAARERKASERPLTLAIVNDDASGPKALQAGANSILRRPLLLNQVRDTLTTARDLLRARVDSANAVAQAAAASAAASTSVTISEVGKEKTLRAGEFLSAPTTTPGSQFETEAASHPAEAAAELRTLQELEPVASSVPVEPPPPAPDEPKSLEELLRSRGVGRRGPSPESPAASGKPELFGYDQAASHSSHSAAAAAAPARSSANEQKQEAQLFAYIAGESEEPKRTSSPRFRLSKGTLIVASILASCAIVLAPQAPWHPQVKVLWSRGQHSLHAWLNPQPVTTPVAPTAHEDFGRAGDEYKLPVAENIPDATTDPSQISVVPVVDPTAKKPNTGTADQPAVTDTPAVTPADGTQTPATQPADTQPLQTTPAPTQTAPGPAVGTTAPSNIPVTPPTTAPAPTTQNSDPPAIVYTPATSTPITPTPAPPKRQPAPYVPPTTKVPSSLQSQMATMVPDASGNKPADAAMQSIEPVAVSELTERALLTDQPPLDYPAAAGTQQGTVILQALIGRDGTVQDAKFVQGSLVFARSAIEGVKRWKFKPYVMNGRPVSVQVTLTLKFSPGH